jgi:hypothetical protein
MREAVGPWYQHPHGHAPHGGWSHDLDTHSHSVGPHAHEQGGGGRETERDRDRERVHGSCAPTRSSTWRRSAATATTAACPSNALALVSCAAAATAACPFIAVEVHARSSARPAPPALLIRGPAPGSPYPPPPPPPPRTPWLQPRLGSPAAAAAACGAAVGAGGDATEKLKSGCFPIAPAISAPPTAPWLPPPPLPPPSARSAPAGLASALAHASRPRTLIAVESGCSANCTQQPPPPRHTRPATPLVTLIINDQN